MNIRVFLTLVMGAFILTANAQVDIKTKKKENTQQSPKEGDAVGDDLESRGGRGGVKTERMQAIKATRTELYSRVVKRYGRWEGYGKPITKEYASHLRVYFKLTFAGSDKYPTRLQSFDGYHRLTTNHNIGTYLSSGSDKDQGADSIWAEKLKTVCQWDFVYNDKNEASVERGYDADSNLVYSYYPVKIGPRTAGTFTDAWGMPAKLRKAGGAQVVYISYDENGFENLHEFYDEQGFRQKNSDGAYMARMTNHPDGLVLSKASCNISGEKVLDNFGNCGLAVEYDGAGNSVSDINMNEKWVPDRVKSGNDPFYYNMIKRNYEYDKYGRLLKISFVDLENRPDTNRVGIHSQVITYNERGDVTSFSYYDVNGKPRINPYDGFSRWENQFDSNGRILYSKNSGDSATLMQKAYSEMFWTYDKKGNEISHLYIDFNGDSVSGDAYVRTPKGLRKLTANDIRPQDYVEIRRFTNSRQIVTIEYDKRGRQILWYYSDWNGNPIAPYGYWKNITAYEEYGDSLKVMTDYYIDTLSAVVQLEKNSWGIKKEESRYENGKLAHVDIYQYNADSSFYNAWRNIYDSKGNKTGEASLNQYGNISRRGKTLYHHCAVEYDIKGNKGSSYVGYDEFNEPGYIEDYNSVSHFWNFANGDLTYYDEHGQPIADMKSFMDSLPAVMSISVTDAVAYNLGLRDGDIILKYGDWCPGQKMQQRKANNYFYFKLIEFADKEKEVTVLRHLPDENKSVILTVPLPVGTIQELGFFPQLIYYTEREKQRHDDTLQEYLTRNGLSSLGKSKIPAGVYRIYIRKPKRLTGYVPTFGPAAPHIYNPAIVLSMAKYLKRDGQIIADKYWKIGMGKDTLSKILDSEDLPAYYISVSTNLKDTYDGFPYEKNAHSWGFVDVTLTQYVRIKSVNENYIGRRGDTFNPAYRRYPEVAKAKEPIIQTPTEMFNDLKKAPGVIYTPRAISYVNSDSIRLPGCYQDLEMIYVGNAQCQEVYNRVKEGVQNIDTTGYVRLPNFYSDDLALVKPAGNNLFSEIFLVYFLKSCVKVFYQKGLFSLDELTAMQKTYGKSKTEPVLSITDEDSRIPLIIARTELDGLARQTDLEGMYVVLEYNDWNMSYGLESIVETLEKGKESKKRLVLMRVHMKDDEFNYFDEPQMYEFGEGTLGMRMMDRSVKKSRYDRVLSAYEKFKITRKKR